jgi:hypothetical protein
MDGFSACIVRDLWLLLHPIWNETPPGHGELAFAVSWVHTDNRDLIGGGHIVTGRKV